MEQYIPKSAIKAELDRKKIPFKRDVEDGNYPTYLCAIMNFEDFINTLEVKEVDLDKEIDLVEDKYHGFESLSRADIIDIAKHFFALGLRTQKGEEV